MVKGSGKLPLRINPQFAKVPIFSKSELLTIPGDIYRDSIAIDGKQTIVRESDGIHLNEDGASVAADLVLQAVDRDFDY